MLSRRKLLSGAGVGVMALPLAACGAGTSIPTVLAGFQTQWTAFVDQVQAIVLNAKGFIPIADSIAATVASLFGPGWEAAINLGISIVNQVAGIIIGAVTALPPAAAAAMYRRLQGSSSTQSAVIGVTPPTHFAPHGVVIHGYH